MSEPDWLKTAKEKGLVITEGPTAKLEPAAGKRVKGVKLSEAEFQEQVIAFAHDHNWLVAHFRRVRVQRGDSTYWETPVAADGAGWPDLILVKGKRLIAAELKIGRNKQTAEQLKWGEALTLAFNHCHYCEFLVWRPSDWPQIATLLGDS